MASGKGVTRQNAALDWLLGVGTPTRPETSNPIKIALCITTDPTESSAATGLTGTGYTAGGTAITFDTAASGSTDGDTGSAISWTNGSGGTWTITGAIIHDAAGAAHPAAADMIYWDDLFDVSVPDAATLEIAIDGVTITES